MSQNTKKPIQILDGAKRTCEYCGKDFFCLNLGDYRYAINHEKRIKYYCCHTCWSNAKKQLNIRYYRRIK